MNQLLMQLLKDGVRRTTPFPLGTILVHFIDQVSIQEQTLADLNFKVDQLLTGSFRKAKLFLEEAEYAETPNEQKKFITKARDRFMDAAAMTVTAVPLISVQANLFTGICYELLGKQKQANRWYQITQKRLEDLYPDEMKFIGRVTKKQKTFSQELSDYEKAKKGHKKLMREYERQLKDYKVALANYQQTVKSLSFIDNNGRRQVRKAILQLFQRRQSPTSPRRNRSPLIDRSNLISGRQRKQLPSSKDPLNRWDRPLNPTQRRPDLQRQNINPQFPRKTSPSH